MTRSALLCLRDILENMQDVEEFIRGVSFEQLISDKMRMKAVLRSIEIIGEATKNVPRAVRSRYPSVPWREMAGMRDKVIHEYFGVDPESVWFAVNHQIPQVKPLLEQAIQDLTSGESSTT